MKINFAQVPANDVDTFGDDGLFGPDDSGNFYYQFVEFGTNPGGTEEIAINDGCGRYMPVMVDHIPALITALRECYNISASITNAQKIQDYVNTNSQAYVEGTHVEYESISSATSWPF